MISFHRLLCKTCQFMKPNNLRYYSVEEHNPFRRTWNTISSDISQLFGISKKPFLYPEHADIVIIGGGFIGSSVAYWLKTRAGDGLSVVVIEKDISFQGAQNNISLGNINLHNSQPENIQLSQYGVEFIRNSKEFLTSDIDIQYYPSGRLILACEKYAEKLETNVSVLRECGLKNNLLSSAEIAQKLPWINTSDIKLGSVMAGPEGYFNSWMLLKGLIQKSQQLGAIYVNAEVTGFELQHQRDVLMEGVKPGSFKRINRVLYKTPNNEEYAIKFSGCILATGAKSNEVAQLAEIGVGDDLLSIPVPIEKREHKVFSVACSEKLRLDTPTVMDTSGLWFRKNKLENNLICGVIPLLSDNKSLTDEEFYKNIIEPLLVNRVPQCKNAEFNCVANEEYDYNTYDDTGILGAHPYHNNLYIATGFGMNGCVHAPGIGRAIAELIIDSFYKSIDLTRFGFDRLIIDEPVIESNVY